jgi:hypothetical protein
VLPAQNGWRGHLGCPILHIRSFTQLDNQKVCNPGQRSPFFTVMLDPAMDTSTMNHKLRYKLRKASHAPPSYPGAAPDSDRARRPALTDPPATGQELAPGDRVEGLGDFGKPTGEFGTVEKVNEEDALVKWDDDGRRTLHQPWLQKIGHRESQPRA